MHSWQIKCVAFSVTVSLADAEVESEPELDIQQAAPPCFASKHTTHCPESRSCLKHEKLQVGRHLGGFFGVARCVSRIVFAIRIHFNFYINHLGMTSGLKKRYYSIHTLSPYEDCLIQTLPKKKGPTFPDL